MTFKLKSGNTTTFKNMGSSPLKQEYKNDPKKYWEEVQEDGSIKEYHNPGLIQDFKIIHKNRKRTPEQLKEAQEEYKRENPDKFKTKKSKQQIAYEKKREQYKSEAEALKQKTEEKKARTEAAKKAYQESLKKKKK